MHFEVDLQKDRLFATPEDFKAVLVLDIGTGKVIAQIDGILRPHAVCNEQTRSDSYDRRRPVLRKIL